MALEFVKQVQLKLSVHGSQRVNLNSQALGQMLHVQVATNASAVVAASEATVDKGSASSIHHVIW
jgi:hypothetical protein